MPNAQERLQIWQLAFPEKVNLNDGIDLRQFANKYELSGAEIMNVVQFCCLRAVERGEEEIRKEDLVEGIRKEFMKAGRVMG